MRKKIIGTIAEARIRISRGQALFYDIKNALMIATAFKVLFSLNLLETAILTLISVVGFFIMGFLDLKFFKLFQKEAELSAGNYNPFFKKMNKKIGSPNNRKI